MVEQHAMEAALLWPLRDAAVLAPHYRLSDLDALDERIEANVDGLRIAGDRGWALCADALHGGEAGEMFAAAVIATLRGDAAAFAEVLDAGGEDRALVQGIVSALGWVPWACVERFLPGLLAPGGPAALRAIGIAACAVHRRDPGPALTAALLDGEDRQLVRRAAKAAGELGRRDLTRYVTRWLAAEDEGIRFAAAWSAALLGESSSLSELRTMSEQNGPLAERALDTVLRCAPREEATELVRRLVAGPDARRALLGAGLLGDPVFLPWILEQLDEPKLARRAGFAFSLITGLDLEEQGLQAAAPEGFQAGPTDDPEDEDVAPDPDADLTWPDAEKLRARWRRSPLILRAGVRHLCGLPLAEDTLDEILRTGSQRCRAAAAIELALRRPGTGLAEIRAPAFRQLGVELHD